MKDYKEKIKGILLKHESETYLAEYDRCVEELTTLLQESNEEVIREFVE